MSYEDKNLNSVLAETSVTSPVSDFLSQVSTKNSQIILRGVADTPQYFEPSQKWNEKRERNNINFRRKLGRKWRSILVNPFYTVEGAEINRIS